MIIKKGYFHCWLGSILNTLKPFLLKILISWFLLWNSGQLKEKLFLSNSWKKHLHFLWSNPSPYCNSLFPSLAISLWIKFLHTKCRLVFSLTSHLNEIKIPDQKNIHGERSITTLLCYIFVLCIISRGKQKMFRRSVSWRNKKMYVINKITQKIIHYNKGTTKSKQKLLSFTFKWKY